MKKNNKYTELRDKIMKGMKLAIDRLIEKEKANDGYLVVINDKGKPVRVKARDITR